MRAVDIRRFDPRPNTLDTKRTPWVRLADFVSAELGRPVPLAAIQLRASDYAKLHGATRLWLMLRGLDNQDPSALPHGQLARCRTEFPGYAYVDEAVLP